MPKGWVPKPLIFRKIEHEKIAEAVIRQIESLILEGALQPGDKLPAERELAKRFDISRPTLREAIKELEARRLLVSRQGGSTHVASVLGSGFGGPLIQLFRDNPATAIDYLEFRQEIEGKAASLAAIRATEPDRRLIEHNFQRMLAAHSEEDPHEEAAVDADFHLSIIEAAHNVVILHIMHGLFELLREGVFYNRGMLYRRKGIREVFLAQHRAIYEGVMEGDEERAREAVNAHLSYVRNALQDLSRREVWQQAAQRRLESIDEGSQRGRRRAPRVKARQGARSTS